MAYFIIIAVMIKKYTEFTISKIPTFYNRNFFAIQYNGSNDTWYKNKRTQRINSKYDDR